MINKFLESIRKKRMTQAIKNADNSSFDKIFLKLKEGIYYEDKVKLIKIAIEHKNEYVMKKMWIGGVKDSTLIKSHSLPYLIIKDHSNELKEKSSSLHFIMDIDDKMIKSEYSDDYLVMKNIMADMLYWAINLENNDALNTLLSRGIKDWHYQSMINAINTNNKNEIDFLSGILEHDKLMEFIKKEIVGDKSQNVKKGLDYFMEKKAITDKKMIGSMVKETMKDKKIKTKTRKI